MAVADTEEFLTAAEIAARLKVRPKTVADWLRLGRVPGHRFSGRLVRFKLGEVVAALEASRPQHEGASRAVPTGRDHALRPDPQDARGCDASAGPEVSS